MLTWHLSSERSRYIPNSLRSSRSRDGFWTLDFWSRWRSARTFFARSSVWWESVGKYNPFGSNKGRPFDPIVCSSESLSLASSSMEELFCIAAVEEMDSTLLGVVPCILASCSASSLSLEPSSCFSNAWNERWGSRICLVVLHCAKRLEQFLLELRSHSKELDKGLFVG